MKRGSGATAEDKSTIAALRRRLFILAAYVVVTAALLVYVSYSNFKLMRTATVQFPETEFMAATLTLTPNIQDGKDGEYAAETNMSAVLADLAPGDVVTKLAQDEDVNHRLTLTVKSFEQEEDNGGGGSEPEKTVTPLAMDYHLVLKSYGHLPLELLLIRDGDSVSYKTQRTGSYTNTYEYRFYLPGASEDDYSQEAVFHFDEDEDNEHKFYIYVGWLQSPRKEAGWSDGHRIYSTSVNTNENGRYRHEVDELTVKAEITELDPGVEKYSTAPAVVPGIPIDEPVALAGASMAPVVLSPEPGQPPEQGNGE